MTADAPDPMTAEAFASAAGVSDAALGDLEVFRRLVTEWNDRTDLVGPSFNVDFWRRHAFDSAQLFHVEQSALRWADVGAGAGFPGVVLAILMKDRPGAEVHLIESLGKRVRFLETVCQALSLPTVLHHARAESLKPALGVEVVTARACAPLSRLLGYTRSFFERGAYGLFLKGRTAEQELREARQSWTFESAVIPSLSDPTGNIVRITKLAVRG